jgi:putative transposase
VFGVEAPIQHCIY